MKFHKNSVEVDIAPAFGEITKHAMLVKQKRVMVRA